MPRSRTVPPLPAALAALLAACGGPAPEPEPLPPPPGEHSSGPWTDAFYEPANLVADEVVIEGPPALREHFSVRQDPRGTVPSAETTTRGFLQKVEARPAVGYVEIHATLDRWQIVAFRRLTWLERPGPVPVVVRARGRAMLQRVESGEVERGEVLEFRGELPR